MRSRDEVARRAWIKEGMAAEPIASGGASLLATSPGLVSKARKRVVRVASGPHSLLHTTGATLASGRRRIGLGGAIDGDQPCSGTRTAHGVRFGRGVRFEEPGQASCELGAGRLHGALDGVDDRRVGRVMERGDEGIFSFDAKFRQISGWSLCHVVLR